jgi:hypothetical protein
MRLVLLLTASSICWSAGPRDFGRSELDKAVRERRLSLKISDSIGSGPPEGFEIQKDRVIGADA